MSVQEIDNKYPIITQHGDRIVFGFVLGILTFWLFANGMLYITPLARKDLGFEGTTLNFAISIAGLFAGCFGVVAGGLADKYGRMRITYIGFILSIIGSLFLIIPSNAIIFSLGRILQGISVACIMSSTMASIKEYFDGPQRQRALSFWVIGSWGGSGLSFLVCGFIATYLGWRSVYIASIIMALVGLWMIKGAPETKSSISNRPMDKIGLISFIVALFLLNLVISKFKDLGWLYSLILLVISLTSLIFFTKTEKRLKEKAFIDFELFKNKSYLAACLTNFLLNTIIGAMFILSSYLQTGRGFTASNASLLSLGYLITILLMIRIGEKMLQKFGARKPMILGPLLTVFGVICMSLTFLESNFYIVFVMLGYILLGLGLGMYATPSTDTAVSNSPSHCAGMASGFYKMTSSIGGAFGLSLLSTTYLLLSEYVSISAAVSVGFIIGAIFCGLTAFVSFTLLPNTKQ